MQQPMSDELDRSTNERSTVYSIGSRESVSHSSFDYRENSQLHSRRSARDSAEVQVTAPGIVFGRLRHSRPRTATPARKTRLKLNDRWERSDESVQDKEQSAAGFPFGNRCEEQLRAELQFLQTPVLGAQHLPACPLAIAREFRLEYSFSLFVPRLSEIKEYRRYNLHILHFGKRTPWFLCLTKERPKLPPALTILLHCVTSQLPLTKAFSLEELPTTSAFKEPPLCPPDHQKTEAKDNCLKTLTDCETEESRILVTFYGQPRTKSSEVEADNRLNFLSTLLDNRDSDTCSVSISTSRVQDHPVLAVSPVNADRRSAGGASVRNLKLKSDRAQTRRPVFKSPAALAKRATQQSKKTPSSKIRQAPARKCPASASVKAAELSKKAKQVQHIHQLELDVKSLFSAASNHELASQSAQVSQELRPDQNLPDCGKASTQQSAILHSSIKNSEFKSGMSLINSLENSPLQEIESIIADMNDESIDFNSQASVSGASFESKIVSKSSRSLEIESISDASSWDSTASSSCSQASAVVKLKKCSTYERKDAIIIHLSCLITSTHLSRQSYELRLDQPSTSLSGFVQESPATATRDGNDEDAEVGSNSRPLISENEPPPVDQVMKVSGIKALGSLLSEHRKLAQNVAIDSLPSELNDGARTVAQDPAEQFVTLPTLVTEAVGSAKEWQEFPNCPPDATKAMIPPDEECAASIDEFSASSSYGYTDEVDKAELREMMEIYEHTNEERTEIKNYHRYQRESIAYHLRMEQIPEADRIDEKLEEESTFGFSDDSEFSNGSFDESFDEDQLEDDSTAPSHTIAQQFEQEIRKLNELLHQEPMAEPNFGGDINNASQMSTNKDFYLSSQTINQEMKEQQLQFATYQF